MHQHEDPKALSSGCKAFLAKKRNQAKKPQVSMEDMIYGNLLATFVRNVHVRSRLFVNYNERSIAVKVALPNNRDQLARDRTHTIALERFIAREHVQVKKLDGSWIYHLPYTNTPR